MDVRTYLRKQLLERGLDRAVGDVLELARTGWRIRTQAAGDETLPTGVSRIGGVPDLPRDVEWPVWNGLPLAFIAQIRLEEREDADSPLPLRGVLSFFYDAEQRTWGFDPADRGSWRVFHFDDPTRLVRREPPRELPPQARYTACCVEFSQLLSLPTYGMLIERLDMSEMEQVAYWGFPEEWADEQVGDEGPRHQLLGHPEPIQGEMHLECQLASNGLYCGDASYRDHPRYAELEPGAGDWTLLLQIDSDDAAGMMWGDVGMIYYWIRRKDLARGAFERVWLVLQCG